MASAALLLGAPVWKIQFMNRSSNAPPCRIPLTPQFESGVDRDHRRQVGRVHLGQGVLGAAGIAGAERADLAVGPLLRGDPLDDVVAVLRVVGDQCQVPSLAYRPRMSLATTT